MVAVTRPDAPLSSVKVTEPVDTRFEIQPRLAIGQRAARQGAAANTVGEDILRLDLANVDRQDVSARHRHVVVKARHGAARTVGNRHVEAVADAARADLAQPAAVAEDFVRHHHQEVVLREIQSEPLAKTEAGVGDRLEPRGFAEETERHEAVLDGCRRPLHRRDIRRAGGNRHVAVDRGGYT
jgi:hypothetical protein